MIEASDGEQGLEVFDEHRPDVVYCDIFMPRINGAPFVRVLLGRHPDARLVILSGGGRFAPQEVLDTFLDLGIADTLEKPFSGPICCGPSSGL